MSKISIDVSLYNGKSLDLYDFNEVFMLPLILWIFTRMMAIDWVIVLNTVALYKPLDNCKQKVKCYFYRRI